MNCLNVYNKSLKKKGVLSITSAEKKKEIKQNSSLKTYIKISLFDLLDLKLLSIKFHTVGI